MVLDVPVERFHSKPEMLRDFVYRLSGILKRFPLPAGLEILNSTKILNKKSKNFFN